MAAMGATAAMTKNVTPNTPSRLRRSPLPSTSAGAPAEPWPDRSPRRAGTRGSLALSEEPVLTIGGPFQQRLAWTDRGERRDGVRFVRVEPIAARPERPAHSP